MLTDYIDEEKKKQQSRKKVKLQKAASSRVAEVLSTASKVREKLAEKPKTKPTPPPTEEQRKKEEKRRKRAETNSQSAGYGEESWVEPVAKAIVATNQAAASKKGKGFGDK